MKLITKKLLSLFVLSFFAISSAANAGLISNTLGNTSTGLLDGDTPSFNPIIFTTQSGQDAPFNSGIGHEILIDAENVTWLFSYVPITDTIVSATFSFGIWDHDTSASGSQLDSFYLDGTDRTNELNNMFESNGGSADLEYNLYTFTLNSGDFENLYDGLFSVDLDIGGVGLVTNPLTGMTSESFFNSFHLISSTLNITTEDAITNPPNEIPEPSVVLLFSVALFSLRRYSRQH